MTRSPLRKWVIPALLLWATVAFQSHRLYIDPASIWESLHDTKGSGCAAGVRPASAQYLPLHAGRDQ